MIDAIDLGLKRILEEEIGKSARDGLGKNLQISFDTPLRSQEKSDTPRLNLYLHEVTENTKQRLDPYQVVRKPGESAATRKRSRIRMDLCYLVTAQGPDSSTEHRLLTHALGAFLRNPSIPQRFLEEAEYETDATVTVAQPAGDNGEHPHTDLWQSLGANLRASLSVRVTASFDPFETYEVRVVKEMIVGLGFLREGDAEGRPREVRSYRVSAAGIVTDQSHQPLPGSVVSVKNRSESATADDRGFFYITDLPSGPHTLVARRRGFGAVEIKCEVPPSGRVNEVDPLLISLTPNANKADALLEAELFPLAPKPGFYDAERRYPPTVAGKLLLEDGRPASFVPVRMGDQRSVTDVDGRYRFLERGPNDKVYATYAGLGEIEVTVADGEGVVKNGGEPKKVPSKKP